TRAKITRTVHRKGQRAESKDQRADMCTYGQPRTSSTNVLCVLTDTHRRPVCGDGHPRTSCLTWAKITQTVHGKGQRAESKDQRADMCTDGQPRTSSTDVLCMLTDTHGRFVCADGHPRTQPTWNKITQTVHGKGQRAESKDQRADMCTEGQPRTYSTTSCVCWQTPTDVLCVLNRQPTRAKITRTVHRKGQRAESKDQRADMCTDGQPQTSCVC
ncbi:unnamed protein product, partial [Brassica rapa]